MQVRLNHKGPGHPWKAIPLGDLIAQLKGLEPLVVVDQREYDYLQGLSLMLGRELDVRLWETMVIGSNMFFTYVQIPDVNQGE